MTRLQETHRLITEWVRNSIRARLEPVRAYDLRHCANDIDKERARREAIAAAAMAQQFLVSQFSA